MYKNFTFNNKDNFPGLFFVQQKEYGKIEVFYPVNCTELIDSWTYLPEEERASIKEEILFPEAMLCPNITGFQM